MKHIIKTFGLLSVFAVFSGAFAATSRVSVMNTASPRLPSIAGHIVNTGTTTTTTSSTASYLDNSECIEKYTDCIKVDDVCGSDLEECTTNVLFHGQMAKCSNVLYQCSSSGITALFGVNNISALGACTTNSNGDITGCTYPSDGSVLGQLITGAKISNQLSTEQCVKSYTRCLQREGNCGADFELCTTKKEFKKQALLCDSTLQRCQSDGKTQLFGSVQNADSLTPGDETRIGQLIADGQSTAAENAVKTCQKVTDNCLISACTQNPLRCVTGIKLDTIETVDIIENGTTTTNRVVENNPDYSTEVTTANSVQKLLKTQCLETIGGNQYCHMTYREKNPTKKDLVDIDLQEDVFALAYAARKDAVNTKIQEAVKKFDTKAKDACYETIKSCAMRSCGGGIGSVCYKQAKTNTNNFLPRLVNTSVGVAVNRVPYNEIKAGCSAIVNADANCIYAATSGGDNGYQYEYTKDKTFEAVFPQYTGSETDLIGAVGRLNELLASSYNDAAIEDMKKKCQTVALSCIRSMCGKDYVNCYRNRTDIVAGVYNTTAGSIDRSMNKVGGLLDYNIVMGLCMDNVKNSSVCEEHLKIAAADVRAQSSAVPDNRDFESWGTGTGNNQYDSVREAWSGVATTLKAQQNTSDVVVACRASDDNIVNVNSLRTSANCYGTIEPVNGSCPGEVDENGCAYNVPVYQGWNEYVMNNGAKTLFQTLLADEEVRVQQLYNAKITKEQNVCTSNSHNNNGTGIMGRNDIGSTFQWVKLRSGKIPNNYAMKGLKENQFIQSNDLYGSFCRMRVTVVSDDKDIQDNLGEDAVAYFAVGDAFTCGSWISQDKLKKISNSVADRAKKEAGKGSAKDGWITALGTVLPAIGGFAATSALQNNGASLGGLLSGDGIKSTKDKKDAADNCMDKIDEARTAYYAAAGMTDQTQRAQKMADAVSKANRAKSYAREAGVNVSDIQFVVEGAYIASTQANYKWNTGTKNKVNELKEISLVYGSNNQDCIFNAQSVGYSESECKYRNLIIQSAKGAANMFAQPANPDLVEALTKNLIRIQQACKDNNVKEKDFCKNLPNDFTSNVIEVDGTDGQQKLLSDYNQTSALFSENLKKLENGCSKAKDGTESKSNKWINVAGAALAGAAGFTVVKGIQDVKYENVANEAVKDWMEKVGDHIECYVGTESVGTYGDVVALEID